MKTRKFLAVMIAIVLCLATLGSCAGNSQTPAPTGGGSSQGQTADPAEEVVYYMSCTWEEAWWDPALFMSVSDASLGGMIYENLVEILEDGSIGPQLAKDWDISDDGTTCTFYLRDDVQWHKGYGQFTSADVKFTLERHADPEVGSFNADNLHIDNIVSIDCPDDYTVVLQLKQPDVDLLHRLGMYYGIIVCKAHNDKNGAAAINTDPIGTGSFVFDGGTLILRTEAVRNHEWWGDFTGNIDRVVSTYMSDTNTIYASFDNGELHSIGLYDKDKMAEYEAKGYNIHSVPLLQLLYIGVNMQTEPFNDPLVREALFYAIDVEYYLENLYHGSESAVGSYLPPGSKYALTDYFKYKYDPEKSKQLLADAGYPDGLEFTMWGANDSLGQPPAIMALDQLSKAGFKPNMQSVEFGVWITEVRGGTAPMWVGYNTTGVIGDDSIIRYQSEYYPGNNWCGVMDAEYDAYVQAGIAATTEEERFENFYAAQRRMIDLQAIYPVSTFSVSQVLQDNVSGMQSYGDQGFRLHTVVIS